MCDVTRILGKIESGDPSAAEELLPLVYEELRKLAAAKLAHEKPGQTLQATALVHEAYLRLVGGETEPSWDMRALEKDRARRYASASGLAADVQHYLNDEAVVACPPSAAYRFKKYAQRNKAALLVAGLILFVCMLLGSGIGWTFRDRVARQARVSEQIELILDEVGRLEQEQKWTEALAAAQRASAVLASGEAAADLQERVQQAVSELELVERLEEIRLLTSVVKEEGFDYAGSNRHYAAAFHEFGVEVDALPTDELAGGLRSHPGVLPALIVALDEWARCRRGIKDEAGEKTLNNLAQQLDADPWRRRVRDAWAANNEKALEELAAAKEINSQTPSTVAQVAWALTKSGRRERAKEVLGSALREHPDDFWLHFEAAHANRLSRPPHWEEATRHYTAALALRPQSVAALSNLGAALYNQKKLDEAIACQRTAIKIDPKVAAFYNNLGSVLNDQAKLDEAVACYRKAIEIDPQRTAAHTNLCRVLLNQGKVDEAEAVGHTAVKIEVKLIGQIPADRTKAQLYNLACFYSQASAAVQADPQKAEEHAAQAVALLSKAHTATDWPDAARVKNERDLDPLRDREDFRQLIQKLEEKDKQ